MVSVSQFDPTETFCEPRRSADSSAHVMCCLGYVQLVLLLDPVNTADTNPLFR